MSAEELHRRIEEALQFSLEDQWKEIAGEWAEAPLNRTAVEEELVEMRDRVLSALLEIDTVPELRRALAAQYVELRARWGRLLVQMQAQMSQHQQVEERLIYRATCVHLCIQQLEPLLCWDHVDTFTEALSEPFHLRGVGP